MKQQVGLRLISVLNFLLGTKTSFWDAGKTQTAQEKFIRTLLRRFFGMVK